MCYSLQSSLIGWVISTVIAGYLWRRNRNYDRWNSAFILSFSAVQLWEAGIWNGKNVEIFIKLIALTIALQPIVQTTGAWYFASNSQSKILKFLIFVYSAIWIYTLFSVFTEDFWVTTGPNGHLIWNSTASDGVVKFAPLYLFGLFFGVVYGLPATAPLLTIGVLTVIWTLSKGSLQEFPSLWCFSVVAYSVAALFV